MYLFQQALPLLFFLLLSPLLLNAQGAAYIHEVHTQNIEGKIDSLFSEWNDSKKPGASVAVVRNGQIIFKKGYGSANLEYNIPNSPSTVFHIASVSKQFTAFSILLLAAEGKLSIDDDIRKYIPEVPDFGKKITLRHLATHTSGLRDQWNLLAMAGWRLDDVITKEHVLTLVKRQKELNFNPGEEYLYCNTGFTLLAEVVARVSEKSFAEYTKEKIFEPLGMTSTLFYDDHEKIVKNRAYSYSLADQGYKKRVLSYANAGATSLFTTVEDLSLWADNFNSPKVGNQEIIDQLNTEAVLNNGETFGGAMGQFVGSYKGLKQIQHGGADAGYRTYFARFPEQDFAVIVFSNLASFNPGGMARKVADVYLHKLYAEPEEENTKEVIPIAKVKRKKLETFSGNYWNSANSRGVKIYLKDDSLRYALSENIEYILIPVSDSEFTLLNAPASVMVKFEDKPGSQISVTINNGDPEILQSYEPAEYSSKELLDFAGAYYSEELGATYTFEVSDGKLLAKHIRLGEILCDPVRADHFKGNQWYFGNIKFERNSDKSITGFKVSNGRVRNLSFTKL